MQTVRGTKDLFGEDIIKYNFIINKAKEISKLYNFKEIITPIFEFSDLFERNLGDSSDIISKEVYKFKDKGNNILSLRPEFTAGIVRAIITNQDLRNNFPLKLFSYGPAFRYDRPQKGRYRQFNQINFEYFGNEDFMADVNIIQMANNLLKNLELNNDITLEINSLGCEKSRFNFETSLKEYFNKYKENLSTDSKIRLEKNVLRILDSKDENDKKIIENAPKISEFHTNEDKIFLNNILEKLTFLKINFKINNLLVRGLDYYTSTVFEFTTNNLGAQSTIFAGGRYDKLIKQMGGMESPAIGCAAGVERLILLLNKQEHNIRPISIIPIEDNEINYCLNIQKILLDNNFTTELITNGKMKKKMNIANKINSKFVIIIGEDEVENNILTIKNLDEAKEEKVNLNDITKYKYN